MNTLGSMKAQAVRFNIRTVFRLGTVCRLAQRAVKRMYPV